MCFKWHQLWMSMIHIAELFPFPRMMYCHCPIHFECCIHKGFVTRHHCKSMLLDYIFKQNIYKDSHPTFQTQSTTLAWRSNKVDINLGLVYWKSKWSQQLLEYLNKRFNIFMLQSKIPNSTKSSGRNIKQITLAGYISTWGCLFWWSKRSIQNSVVLYCDFRKYVVTITMSQFTSK